jgi:hypothetical protein
MAGLLFVYLLLSLAFYWQVARVRPGAADFFTPWVATRSWLVEGLDPYGEEVTARSQQGILGRLARPDEDQLAFAYPLPAMVLLAPFALLPYPVAQSLWVCGLLFSACLLSRAWVRPPLKPLALAALLLWTIFFYPLTRGLILGQIGVAVALLFGLGAWLLRSPEPSVRAQRVAGVVLALVLVKPQLFFLALPLLLWRAWRLGHQQFIWSWLVSALLLFGASLVILPGWPLAWLQNVSRYAGYVRQPALISDLLPNAWLAGLVALALLGAVGWWGWQRHDKSVARFTPVLWLSLVVTLLVTPRSTPSDQTLLLLPFLSLIDMSPGRGLALAGATDLLLWGVFFMTLGPQGESAWMRWPLPIIVLLLLLWQDRAVRGSTDS